MNKRKKSKAAMILFLLFLTYFGYVFVEQQASIYSKNAEMSELESEILEGQAVNKELGDLKAMLQSDEYIEKIARERLNLVKKGERVFIDTNK